jgi:polysaccharide deacetylase 2 family uncharacterized protein YibQ
MRAARMTGPRGTRIPASCLSRVLLAVFLSGAGGAAAEPLHPVIAIIIDDIGYRHDDDRRALALPGSVTYAILPHSPHGARISELAGRSGREVILHLPMEAAAREKNRFLGPGALMLEMGRAELQRVLEYNLHSVPGVVGVNNHMGSLLSEMSPHMQWLMEALRARNMFYVDSMTSRRSVAGAAAEQNFVPYLRRDVFLDNQRDEDHVLEQFELLIDLARSRGSAVGIGHPHPETLSVLERILPILDAYGVSLVGLSDLIAAQPAVTRRSTAGRLQPSAGL